VQYIYQKKVVWKIILIRCLIDNIHMLRLVSYENYYILMFDIYKLTVLVSIILQSAKLPY